MTTTYDVKQMAHDAALAVDMVLGLVKSDPDARVWVEQKVGMGMTTDAVWGTADIIVYLPQADELWVIDYKYGRVEVPVIDNPQLLIYLMAALQTLRSGSDGPPRKMFVAIVQPRVEEPIKVMEVPPNMLFREFLPKLKQALVDIDPAHLKKTVIPGPEPGLPKYVVSEDTCKYCPAMHACPEAATKAAEACGFAAEGETTVYPSFLAEWLPLLPVLRSWADSLENSAVQMLENGGAVPGYELGVGRTHRKWSSEEMTLDFLRQKGLPLKTIAPPKLLSVSQMRKVVKESTKKIAYEDIDALSFKPEGKAKLQKVKS